MKQSRRRLDAAALLGVLATGLTLAASESIRDVDFKNLDYPFYSTGNTGEPEKLTWLPLGGTSLLSLCDGRHKFVCEEAVPPVPLAHPEVPHIEIPSPEVCPSITGGGAAFWSPRRTLGDERSSCCHLSFRRHSSLELHLHTEHAIREAHGDRVA